MAAEDKFLLHAYPQDLVTAVLERWRDPLFAERLHAAGMDPSIRLPDPSVLEQVISTCYQASLMREEERPVMFRLVIGGPHLFPPDNGPPTGLHRLQFADMRPFTECELCHLAPAADFFRALIGVSVDRQMTMQMWGMVHSGTRWMQPISGGTQAIPPLPWAPVIYVRGPGRISVGIGPEIIASLNGGQISPPSLDFFSAPWLVESFAAVRSEIDEMHEAARRRSRKPWANLDPEFGRMIGHQVVRRIISLIRNSRHGGMLVYLPDEMGHDISAVNRHISLKYRFREEEPRQRFRTLILKIMNTFAELHGEHGNAAKTVGWPEYVNSRSEQIALLDEAIFDLAHFIAALAAIDGAVVMSMRQDLLGFGGVISEDIAKVKTVTHAFDLEGRSKREELSEEVGTRHRAAYRLCHELRDALAIVISQDGNARFVRWHGGSVTYWDLAPTGMP